jgi:ABC-2 type transport system permease protein
MTTPVDAVAGSVPDAAAARAASAATRPLYWLLRRELWENRYLYIVPLSAAGLALFSFSVRAACALPGRIASLPTLDAARQQSVISMPFSMTASVIFMITYLVGAFYCVDALYGERRDRSILFWKSLPVSDRATVLSKAAVPLVVLPAFIFTIALGSQLLLLLWSTFVVLMSGRSPLALWTRLPLVEMTLVMVYGLVVHALWHAPLYAWLLLVSGWARRVPILWAVLPSVAISVVERIAFGTSHFGHLIRYRLMGTMTTAFDMQAHGSIEPTPARFLATPGLWLGLLVAAGFLAAAVRARRYREPS